MEEGIFELGLACLLKVLVGWCAFCCWGDIFSMKMVSMGVGGIFDMCSETLMSEVC